MDVVSRAVRLDASAFGRLDVIGSIQPGSIPQDPA